MWICRKVIKIWHPELRGDIPGKQRPNSLTFSTMMVESVNKIMRHGYAHSSNAEKRHHRSALLGMAHGMSVEANEDKITKGFNTFDAMGCMLLRECADGVKQVHTMLDVSTEYDPRTFHWCGT